jgi:hypothetical protein
VDAGNSCRGKHPRKTFLGLRRLEGRAIKQELIAGYRQQHARFAVGARAQRGAQLSPRGFILLRGPRMTEVIHSRELEQDVEAADEAARRSGACVVTHQDRVGLKPRLYL